MASIVPQRFTVKDEASADWLVRKLVEAEAHVRRVKEQADREVRRTEREREFLLHRFGPDLRRWTERQLEQHKGRRKSVLLLSGTVGFRSIGSKLVVDDEASLLAWAKRTCKSAVIVVERIGKTVINEHFHTTGEVPRGTHVEPEQQRFYVK